MTDSGDDRVMIAIDPHKASWTAAAVDGSLQLPATIRVPVSREGYRALRRYNELILMAPTLRSRRVARNAQTGPVFDIFGRMAVSHRRPGGELGFPAHRLKLFSARSSTTN
jgi:hypothetical protein